ncbi:endonuclease/exonuclease/phosphatase family protein [Litorilituus sediminis]|uniref:Endonuclease/exonuclease/phosphatase family protein n=1 Tax=Litorilituus sediminis TaxID=718192 RepID=A0A4P6PC95_9GAMM|nr:endonuclease/exonuclease/phosphatase family protein [Litorilituus sediminis]QBG37287.1 endonuclease/exonuclease/phosphatase family protein [Litorilituus sediminis]
MATLNLFNYLAPPYACYDFDRIYSETQWQKKQHWLSNYLSKQQPDIIGFQEVFSIESLKTLVTSHGYKYFAVIDQPEVIDEHIFQKPVVAIASKYPIMKAEAISVNSTLAKTIGLNDKFTFARKVLRATINIPNLGATDCYVVHFKSKRSTLESESKPESKQALTKQLENYITGKWAASLQRGSEATLLMCEIITRREKSKHPIILMGDFNDNLHEGVLKQLTTTQLAADKSQDEAKEFAKYLPQDAWQLYLRAISNEQQNSSELNVSKHSTLKENKHSAQKARTATHYYGSKGSVLDYILLSHEFDASHQDSFFMISQYDVFDKHLIKPNFELDGESSDHAPVMVTLTLRA